MDRDPDSFRVSTWPRRTSVENSSPSRTTHSAAVAPPFMARRTMSWARERRSVSSFGLSSWVEDIRIFHHRVTEAQRKQKLMLFRLLSCQISLHFYYLINIGTVHECR